MKIDGLIIELDPTKQYIFIFNEDVDQSTVENFAKHGIKNGNIHIMDLDGFKIVENSDKIIGFTVLGGDAQ